jgi:hypothetical protein
MSNREKSDDLSGLGFKGIGSAGMGYAGMGYAGIGGRPTGGLTDRIVAHWTFNETSGTRYDSIGVANLTPGTLGSAQANYIQGVLGNAVNFSNENFLIGEHLLPLTGRAVSFSIWIKRDIPGENGYFDDFSLFLLNQYPSFYITQDGRIDLSLSPGGGTEECRVRGQSSINDNQWHHIVGTSDGNLQKMYIDGVLHRVGGDDYETISESGADMSITFPDLPYNDIAINANIPAEDFGTTECSIDSLSVWNRELSAAEVTKLYNNGDGLDYTQY